MPDPLRATVVIGELALVVMASDPVAVPPAVGANVIVTKQPKPAVSELPQLLVCVKPLPVATMDAMVSGPVEVLVRITPCVVEKPW